MPQFKLKLQIAGQVDNAIFKAIDDNNLVYYWIDHPHFDALIAQQGAHLISYKPKQQSDWFWCSPQSDFAKGKAIRGGVPICWPCFGPAPQGSELPKHGFARIADWQLAETKTTEQSSSIHFTLTEHPLLAKGLRLSIEFVFSAAEVNINLLTDNASSKSFYYTGALHTYFASDVNKLQVTGLGSQYIDALTQQTITESDGFCLAPETDRIYLRAETTSKLATGLGKQLAIKHCGNNAVVVWNPGKILSSKMADVGRDNAGDFICIETAITPQTFKVEAGQQHSIQQTITKQ